MALEVDTILHEKAIISHELQEQEPLPSLIDTEAIASVPQHGGSLEKAVQHLKDNPDEPLPGCLKALGFETSEQVIERFEVTDDPTKRSPTIRELKEAERSESDKHAVKPDPPKRKENILTSKIEPEIDHKRGEIIAPEIIETDAQLNIKSNEILEARSDNSKETPTPALIVEVSDILQPDLDIPAAHFAEIKPTEDQTPTIVENVIDQVVLPVQKVDRPSETKATYRPEKQIKLGPSGDLEATAVQDPPFETYEIATEPDLAYPMDDEESEQSGLVSETAVAIEITEFALDDETYLGRTSSDIATDAGFPSREPAEELADTTTLEVEEPHDLLDGLRAYIETLEPATAESANITLESLIEAVAAIDIKQVDGSESLDIKVTKLEQLFVALLDTLNLTYEDETIRQLIACLFTPELVAEITEDYELTIDQRNYMGTHEYKRSFPASLFSRLSQLFKQRTSLSLRLGKYALSTSLT